MRRRFPPIYGLDGETGGGGVRGGAVTPARKWTSLKLQLRTDSRAFVFHNQSAEEITATLGNTQRDNRRLTVG